MRRDKTLKVCANHIGQSRTTVLFLEPHLFPSILLSLLASLGTCSEKGERLVLKHRSTRS
jgi:hypothetical protein